jgi:Holliday junction DNA helicase RuvA
MIAFLRGRIHEKRPSRITIDVQGVGYDVAVPLSTFYVLGDEGSEAALRVHTHVREDALLLYGFATALEQAVFERLIAISGIGPKLALAVLSGIEPGELVGAVQRGDVVRLTRIPGVGKKTAERIGLELKDKLPDDLVQAGAAAASPEDRLRTDLASALVNLGYHRSAVDSVLDALLKEQPSPAFETALRAALRELGRA